MTASGETAPHGDFDVHAVDLTDPALYERGDPWTVWRWLRHNAPVFWHRQPDGPGFWAVTRYRDAVRIYKDCRRFSSEFGIFISSYRRRREPAAGKMLALTDPPRHGKVRATLNRHLSAHTLHALEPVLQACAHELVEVAARRGGCEFVADVAAKLPLRVICELMGVPGTDRAHVLKLTTAAFGAATPRERSIAHQEILLYFAGLISERRRSPADDLVSFLTRAEIDGTELSDEEILLNCDNLIVGGTENVRHAAAGGLLALLERPDQWRRLRAEPQIIDTAVEEILRWTSPALHILRTATEDVAVSGQLIRQGEAVVIWNPSANRDEEAFPRADELDVTRMPNRHLSLGAGEHFCIGAGLARRELRALFTELARAVSSVELAEPVQRLRSFTIFGIERLPVTIIPQS